MPTVAVPAAEGAVLAGELPATSEDAERAGRLLLLVEDHPVNRRVITTQLEAIGFCADTAEDGAQGLERLGERDYALVLADIHMPNMDGYEMARRMRFAEADAGSPRVPIVAVTASALHGELERCRQAGMDDLITKPTTISVLADRLHRMLPDLPWTEGATAAEPALAAEAPASDGQVLDPKVLEEMTGGDAALGESLLEQFVESARADTVAIGEALASGDREQLRKQAHRVVGASRMVGAIALQRAAERLEDRAPTAEADEAELRTLADAVAAEVERVAAHAAQT